MQNGVFIHIAYNNVDRWAMQKTHTNSALEISSVYDFRKLKEEKKPNQKQTRFTYDQENKETCILYT